MSDRAAYEARRARHIETWGAALPDRLGRIGWDRTAIEAHQDEALRSLVEAARAGSGWHRDRLRDVDPSTLRLADLPTMTKADLLTHFDDIATDPRVTRDVAEAHLAGLHDDAYLLDEHHVVASGGSSGTRAVFVYGWDAWVDVHLGFGRHAITAAFADPPPDGGPLAIGVVAAANATHMTNAAGATFRSPAVDVHPFPVTMPLAQIVEGLNALQPHHLVAYASMLGLLAGEADAGRLRIRPLRIAATSEPLLPEVRAVAEAAFGAPVANVWGTSEGGVVAVGCWQSSGMHLNEDLVIVEPVDEANRPVPAGERAAKVLLTNLFNPLLPLIRYELTDEVTMLDEPCPCGSAYRRVADVQGRADDILWYGDLAVHPHVLRSVLARHRELVEHQIRQTAAGVEVLVTRTPAEPARVQAQLRGALVAAGLDGAEAEIVLVPRLERHAETGKLPGVVPLARATPAAG